MMTSSAKERLAALEFYCSSAGSSHKEDTGPRTALSIRLQEVLCVLISLFSLFSICICDVKTWCMRSRRPEQFPLSKKKVARNIQTSCDSHSPMNSPFSSERSGQKEARIVCTREASFKEHMRVKYPLASAAMLKCE